MRFLTIIKTYVPSFWAKKSLRIPLTALAAWSLLLLVGGWLDTALAEATESRRDGTKNGVLTDSILRVVTWNTQGGVVNMGASDYRETGNRFFSGGGTLQTTPEAIGRFGQDFSAFLKTTQADIFLLQEVDKASKRSHFMDFVAVAQQSLPEFTAHFLPNEVLKWGLKPILEPWHFYGATQSGLLSLSRFMPQHIESVKSGSNNGAEAAFVVQEWPYRGKKVSVIHLHNTIGGDAVPALLNQLKQKVLDLYQKGHYVIVGGSFKRCPPFLPYDAFMPGNVEKVFQATFTADFMPDGWSFLYDPVNTTQRSAQSAYTKGQTFEWVSDFFLVSPNVLGRRVNVVPQDFEWSGHQPVLGTFELLPD